MPKRRKVLIGLGGSIALAGCSGETEEEPESEEEPEEESEPKPDPEKEEEEEEVPTETDKKEELFIEEPENIPPYTVESIDDVSYNGTIRYDFNITSEENLSEYSEEDFIKISKQLILDRTSEQDVNALSFTFWREDQQIGMEQAYVVIEWAPRGRWREAEEVDTGDYSRHDFAIRGDSYFEAIEIDAPSSVKLQEEFTISATIVNKGIETDSINIVFRNGTTYQGDEVDLEPGEQERITSPKMTIDSYTYWEEATITIEDSVGELELGSINIEYEPFDLGDSFMHPEHGWICTLTDFEHDEEDEIFYIYVEVDEKDSDDIWLPDAMDFYLFTDEVQDQASMAFEREQYWNTSGWIIVGSNGYSREDIEIRYMDSHSMITSDVIASWQP